MDFLKKLTIHSESLEHIVGFLRQNAGLIPIIKKTVARCEHIYPDASLMLELFVNPRNRQDMELGLLIKCSDDEMDDAMERFFELEQKASEAFQVGCCGRFFVDLYGLHLLRGEDI